MISYFDVSKNSHIVLSNINKMLVIGDEIISVPAFSYNFSIKEKGFGVKFTIVKRYPTSINEVKKVANYCLTEGKDI